jgi:hypothetical protein
MRCDLKERFQTHIEFEGNEIPDLHDVNDSPETVD